MACPNKNTKLYKRLSTQFSEDNINRIWNAVTTDKFNKWYGDRRRDSDGMPEINRFFEVYGADLKAGSLLKDVIKLKTTSDVEKLLSSKQTKGVGKFKNDYYITKNNREDGKRLVDILELHYPGLLVLNSFWKSTDAIGVTDRSEPVVKVNINEAALIPTQTRVFKSETRAEDEVEPVAKEDINKESNLDFIINRMKEYAVVLYNKIRDAQRDNDNVKAESLITQRDELKEAIDELVNNQSLQGISSAATINLDYAEKLLSKEEPTNAEINEIRNIIVLYEEIDRTNSKHFSSSILSEKDLEPVTVIDKDGNETESILQSVQDILDVASRARRFRDRYDNLVKKTVLEAATKRLGREITEEELFTNIKDVSKGNKWFRDIGSVGNDLLTLLATINTDSSRLARQKSIDDQAGLKEASESLKKSSLYNRLGRDKFMDMLWQKDAKGKATGGIINRYTEAYWKKRRQYHTNMRSKKTGVIEKAKKQHYNNHEYVNYFGTTEEQQIEQDRLAVEFGEKRAKEIVDEMATSFAEFRDRKDEYFADIDAIDSDEMSAQVKEYQKEIWMLKNDPKVTLEHLKSGKIITDINGKTVHGSFEFIKAIPKKIDRAGKETSFYDTSYEQIEDDVEAMAYYNFTRDKMQTLLSYYPQAHLEAKGIHKGFIPVLKKDILDKFRQDGSKAALAATYEKISSLYTTKVYSKATNHIDPSTGVAMDTLNIRMLSPEYTYVEGGEKVIDTNNVITDMDEILNQFIPLSNMYHFKSSVESQHKMVMDAVTQLEGVATTGTGEARTSTKGEVYTDNLNSIRELADFANKTFYEVQEKDSASSKKKLTKEEKEQATQIKLILKGLESELAAPDTLTDEELTKLTAERDTLQRELDNLGVNYSGTVALKSTLRWYQLLAQGWNAGSASIEMLYGRVSNLVHAKGGRDYTSKQINVAYKIAVQSVLPGEFSKTSKKFKALIEKLDVVGEVAEIEKKRINHSKKGFSAKRALSPYELMRNADMVSKGSVMAAVLMNTNLEGNTIKEGEVSLWDAYNELGELKEEYRTDANIEQWETNFKETNNMLKIAERIAQINKKNHGNYDPNSPILANSTAMGKMFLQFRRWMLEGFASRWEGTRQDDFLGREVRGRYTTLIKSLPKTFNERGVENPRLATLNVLFKSVTHSMMFKSIPDERLIELGVTEATDQENMRKNAAGIMYAIGIYIGLILAKAALLDDDEKEKASALNFLLNQGGRLQQDMFFYSNPSTATDVTKNFVPVVGLLDKTIDWGTNVSKMVIGYEDYDPEYDGRSAFDGWNKSLVKTGELIPGTAAWIKTYRSASKLYD
jgi:hypothetical protein